MAITETNRIQPSWDVFGSDGEHIGTIDAVNDSYLTVRKGTFLPKDYYVPTASIVDVREAENQVYLSCSKDEFESSGWDQPPETSTESTSAWQARQSPADERQDRAQPAGRQPTGDLAEGDTLRVPRYEEELRAEKSSRQAGEVRVDKNVREEEQAFDVPVSREDVEVRRVAVNRPASESDAAFTEGDTIHVPVRAEQVEVRKEPRVVEELEIRKNVRQDNERVSDTVRREQVNVEKSGDVGVEREGDLVGAGADRTQSQAGWDQGQDQTSWKRTEEEGVLSDEDAAAGEASDREPFV